VPFGTNTRVVKRCSIRDQNAQLTTTTVSRPPPAGGPGDYLAHNRMAGIGDKGLGNAASDVAELRPSS
jgi:hypothetical protein